MITVKQIKAARGLLEWTQDDLADKAIISRPALNNLERRMTSPHSSTLTKIQNALEKGGVEFIDSGVRFRKNILNVEVLEGDNALHRMMDDIYETLMPTRGEVLCAGINERKFTEIGGQKFLNQIKKLDDGGITEKLLICDGDMHLIKSADDYRWVTPNIFNQVPYFVYGDKYAVVLWGPPQKIVIMENVEIAQSFRRQFYDHWKRGKRPLLKKR